MKNVNFKVMAILMVLGILSSLFTVIPASAEITSMVANYDFEASKNGTAPDNWVAAGVPLTDFSVSYVSEGDNHYINLPVAGNTAGSQRIIVDSSKDYIFSVDYKSSVVTNNVPSSLVYIYCYNASNISIKELTFALHTTNGAWDSYTVIADIPEGTDNVGINLRAHPGVGSDATLSYDNVMFYESTTNDLAYGNLDMEETEEIGGGLYFPKDYSFTGTAAIENTNVFSGNNSIKLSNATNDATTTVSTTFSTKYLSPGEHYELMLYFKLVDLDDSATGAKLTVQKNSGGYLTPVNMYTGQNNTHNSTEYFKVDTYTGWRQMMVFFTNSGCDITAKAELTGIGSLYIDKFVLRKASYFVNSDFQGLTGDYRPAGWLTYGVWKTPASDPATAGLELTETASGNGYNNYAKTVKMSYGNPFLKQNLYTAENSFVSNKTYEISADFKDSDGWGMGVSNNGGFKGATHWTTGSSKSWERKAAYHLYDTGTASIALVSRASSATACFDNVIMEVVTEGAKFTNNGAEVTSITTGDITVSYKRPETNFTAPKSVTMVAALYKHVNGVKVLSSVYVGADAGKYVETAASAGKYTGTEPATGYRPAMLSKTFNVPGDGGKYSVEAFFWDGLSTLTPYIGAAVLS